MQSGTIKWFNHDKGYGFIKTGSDEIMLHYSAVPREERGNMKPGQKVSFKTIKGPDTAQAAQVTLVHDDKNQ